MTTAEKVIPRTAWSSLRGQKPAYDKNLSYKSRARKKKVSKKPQKYF